MITPKDCPFVSKEKTCSRSDTAKKSCNTKTQTAGQLDARAQGRHAKMWDDIRSGGGLISLSECVRSSLPHPPRRDASGRLCQPPQRDNAKLLHVVVLTPRDNEGAQVHWQVAGVKRIAVQPDGSVDVVARPATRKIWSSSALK